MLHDVALRMIDGRETSLGEYAGRAVLVVNVASKCGLTPRYATLEKLAEDYADRGLTVLGVPCNQFMGQEPGSNSKIVEFCSITYGVTFPLTEKLEVNGAGAHPLFTALTAAPTLAATPVTCGGTSRSGSSRHRARSSPASHPRRPPTPPT